MKRGSLNKKIKELKAKKNASKLTVDLKDIKLSNVRIGVDLGSPLGSQSIMATVPIKRDGTLARDTIDWSKAKFTFEEMPCDPYWKDFLKSIDYKRARAK